jgi:hypothetical protein
MSLLSSLSALGGLLGKILDRALPDKSAVNAAQSRINEAETAGAGPSMLRHWRGFLGWVLSLLFAWEVIGRAVILTYWPDSTLPPSMLRETLTLLLGMLGLS